MATPRAANLETGAAKTWAGRLGFLGNAEQNRVMALP
jgi:hypothetical protein